MNKILLKISVIAALIIICPAVIAQVVVKTKPTPASPPAHAQSPRPAPVARPADPDTTIQTGEVKAKLDRGGRVIVSNRVGNISITGWDQDTIEATATGEESGSVPIQVSGEESRSRIYLSIPDMARRSAGREIRLDVKLPMYASVELLESARGDVEVTGIDGDVAINSGSGDVKVTKVGALKVSRRSGDIVIRDVKGDFTSRTLNGDVNAENIGGLVDVAATNGDITVRNANSDVRATTATGEVEVHCAKGRAEIRSASGSIMLVGIGGDTDAVTTSGEVTFRGILRENGRYNLKSISGEVEMYIQDSPPGFTATMLTYSGELETAFPLKVNSPLDGGPINRRITGVFGDGGTRLSLDSFSGSVRIVKGGANMLADCK